ncbi:hypothetical protein COO60DRAFT_388640 [Scenedesmus sp. NREL 46B-D3]|nr:hypothetical protein COO60DRAFT_388640 [Scenedesmus sp. NREL 46B-D3]
MQRRCTPHAMACAAPGSWPACPAATKKPVPPILACHCSSHLVWQLPAQPVPNTQGHPQPAAALLVVKHCAQLCNRAMAVLLPASHHREHDQRGHMLRVTGGAWAGHPMQMINCTHVIARTKQLQAQVGNLALQTHQAGALTGYKETNIIRRPQQDRAQAMLVLAAPQLHPIPPLWPSGYPHALPNTTPPTMPAELARVQAQQPPHDTLQPSATANCTAQPALAATAIATTPLDTTALALRAPTVCTTPGPHPWSMLLAARHLRA